VAFKAHPGTALDVQDDAVPVIEGRHDGLGPCGPGQFEEIASVKVVQPGQVPPHIPGVDPATRDGADLG
jgi:hypothetical protein